MTLNIKPTCFTNLTLESVTKDKPFGLTYPTYIIKTDLEYLSQFLIMSDYDDDDGMGLCTGAFLNLDGVFAMVYQYEHSNPDKSEFTISVDNTSAVALGKNEFNISDKLIEALGLDKNQCILWKNEELRKLYA